MYFARPFFWVLLLAIWLLDVALTFVLPHQIAYGVFWPVAQIGLGFALAWICLLAIARTLRPRWPRVAAVIRLWAVPCEAAVLLVLMGVGMRVMDYLTTATALPLTDDWLAQADTWLGFDWLAYFDFVRSHSALHGPMIAAYVELNTAIAVLILGLAITGQHRKVRSFVEAIILCATGSLIVGAFFPAVGAAAHWIPDPSDPQSYAGFTSMPGIGFVADILALRQLDQPMLIGTAPLQGLVSMPSLHTALGVLMIGVARRTWLFWPALAYGAVMIAATPIWGGHYFSDLIAGAAMAVGALALAERGAHRDARPSDAPCAGLQQTPGGRRTGLRQQA
ncbi:MAG: phosphatase PAP2 family protein [Proteobacteria bacterium]|nr:phosphatase PAP2 family protein [Pseudomonadota bacterium]